MIKFIISTIFLSTLSGSLSAQSFFNTVNQDSAINKTIDQSRFIRPKQTSEPKNGIVTIASYLSQLSKRDLDFLESRFLKNRHKSSLYGFDTNSKYKSNDDVLQMYEGESHPLTITNVLKVMDEESISNRLFVLAQSLLETGYYRSNACKNYNNLFGLTNPRTKKLYRFQRWEDSVVAYRKFVQYKYKGGSYLSFLKRIGYAEDPRYISKVVHISRLINKNMIYVVD